MYYYFTFLHSTHAMGATGQEKWGKTQIKKNLNDGVLYVGSASYVLFKKKYKQRANQAKPITVNQMKQYQQV